MNHSLNDRSVAKPPAARAIRSVGSDATARATSAPADEFRMPAHVSQSIPKATASLAAGPFRRGTSPAMSDAAILQLQRAHGNRHVGVILQRATVERDNTPGGEPVHGSIDRSGGLQPGRADLQRSVLPIQRQLDADSAPTPPVAAAVPSGPDPEATWRQIETRATPELLIKLQEIGRRAALDTQTQVNDTFAPYEDSLESDQTFLQVAGIGLGGASNMPQGVAAGGLAGAAGAAVQFAMTRIMDFKSVGQVKTQAAASIGDEVAAQLTSDSALYMSFETDALIELRSEFDQSWARMSDDARSLPPALIESTYVSWFQQMARQKYGTGSPAGASALGSVRASVRSALVPVTARLEDLKSSQRLRRAGAGALGGAGTGALIGGALGAGVFSVPGALIGGAIGAVVGGVGGYFWPS